MKEKPLLSFLIKSAQAVVLYFAILFLVPSNNPLSSLIGYSLVGIIPVLFFAKLLIDDNSSIKFLAFAYIIKILIGVFHYIWFIDPTYFHGSGDEVKLTSVNDFMSMFDQVGVFVDNFDGSMKSIGEYGNMPHAELYALMSLTFKIVGNYYLTIIPLNVVCSLFIALMITYVVKLRGGNYQVALFLCSFFPMTLLSDYFFRDAFGLMICTFALVLVLLSKEWYKILILVFASYLFYWQRTMYVVIPFIAYFLHQIINSSNRKQDPGKIIFYIIIFAFALMFASTFIGGVYEDNRGYTSTTQSLISYLTFPIRYFLCIIGPFPWTQCFNGKVENTFMMGDFFFSAALFYLTIKGYPLLVKDYRRGVGIDYLVIVGFLIMIMGIMNPAHHLGYVGWGLLFFVPTLTRIFQWSSFVRFHIVFFALMILFNILYIMMGLGGIMNAIS